MDIQGRDPSFHPARGNRAPMSYHGRDPERPGTLPGRIVASAAIQSLDAGLSLSARILSGGAGGADDPWTAACAEAVHGVALVRFAGGGMGSEVCTGPEVLVAAVLGGTSRNGHLCTFAPNDLCVFNHLTAIGAVLRNDLRP
jgi:hypothetical protein